MSILPITTIQTALHWENKASNLTMLEEKIAGIESPKGVVILPEMFSTGFSMNPSKLAETMDGETVQWMRRVAAKNRIILTGSMIIVEDDLFYNRLIWMMPDGNCGYYDKRHLFAFAGEDKHYASGNKRLITSVNGWRINLQICYDLRFPVWARQQSVHEGEFTPEFDVLVYVANWPERRSHAWKTLLCARAIENQCYVIGVNRVGMDGNEIYHSGDSMVIDPMGEVLYHMSHEEDISTFQLEKHHLNEIRSKLPFLKDADRFSLFTD